MTPEQEALIEALEAEIQRKLKDDEKLRAEQFIRRFQVATALNGYTAFNDPDMALVDEFVDRATGGILSPGLTFERELPTTYELAVAVGGFPSVDDILFGVNGTPIRPDTPALYLERLKSDKINLANSPGRGGTDPVAPPPSDLAITDPEAYEEQRIAAFLSSDDPEEVAFAQLMMQVRAEREAEDQPKYLGGIPYGTLLPQNFAEVEHNYKVDAGKYEHTSSMLKKEMIEAGPAKSADKTSLKKTYNAIGSHPMFGVGDYAPTMGAPLYGQMDQFSNFATKDPGYITEVQYALLAAGYLDEDDLYEGVWTQDAANAMEDAMIEANYTGGKDTWVDVVKKRAQANAAKQDKSPRGPGSTRRANPLAGRTLVLPAYEKPSIDILNTDVKDLLRNRLGRDPTDWEKTLLADSLEAGYRADYDAQVKAAKANFEAGNRAILQSYRTGKPVTVTTAEAERIDPRAYLQERFEERYAPELQLNEDRETSREDMANVFNVMTSTSRMLGGA